MSAAEVEALSREVRKLGDVHANASVEVGRLMFLAYRGERDGSCQSAALERASRARAAFELSLKRLARLDTHAADAVRLELCLSGFARLNRVLAAMEQPPSGQGSLW